MVATALHAHSRRADRPFIRFNAAAIPATVRINSPPTQKSGLSGFHGGASPPCIPGPAELASARAGAELSGIVAGEPTAYK